MVKVGRGQLDEIRDAFKSIGLVEAKEQFSVENIPSSIQDKSFIIQPVPFEPGDFSGTENKSTFSRRVKNVNATFTILALSKIAANNMTEVNKRASLIVEQIITAVLAIEVGNNAKDQISFVGSTPTTVGSTVVNTIGFNINYRIN